MKKLIAFLLSVTCMLTSALFFTGCNDKGKDKVIRVFLMTNSEQDAYFEEYFEEMETRFGCTIEFTGATFSDYYNQLRTELKDTPPDIFYIRPGDIKKFVQDGLLADFNSYIASSEFTSKVDISKIYKHAVDMYRYDGSNVGVSNENAPLYGINLGFSYQGLGYNKNILLAHESEIKAAGIKMPWEFAENESYTFEEFATVAQICTTEVGGGTNGDKPVYGLNMSTEIILPYI
ncbi:MAG: extracellular solute-binding protein, partial [Clostridia bacterium]|nr:extracellular solute-binding protein [Clostridia bacterium]